MLGEHGTIHGLRRATNGEIVAKIHMPFLQNWGDMGGRPTKVPDVPAKIKGGRQGGVEAISQFFGLLPGRQCVADKEAFEVNSDIPMSVKCQTA